MWQKIKCLFGMHTWVEYVRTKPTQGIFVLITNKEIRCLHCGKKKK